MVSAEPLGEPDAIAVPVPYWVQTREPLASLIFLLPLLLIYEAGIVWMAAAGGGSFRNGADYLMRSWLQQAGLNAVLLPVLVTGVLLGWHRYGQYPWRISKDTLVGMFAESLLFAVMLLLLAQLQDVAFQCLLPGSLPIHEPDAPDRPLLAISGSIGPVLISFVGAGVYEEVLFRLTLLPLCLMAMKTIFRMPGLWASALAVFLTSLAFSVAHHAVPGGEAFSLFTFTFRILAGCFFATLFLVRGFGITVGCHALYDILVGILTLA